jgi:16S rRNA (guanine966-N2)-methyltransferase
MRVISGKLKGKSIFFLKSTTTRPLKDSVKENIFNVLHHSNLINLDISQSNVLDLYSGVGSFGIECISRGSKKVVFVDNDKKAIEVINKNLNSLSILDKAKVINDKIINFLNTKTKKKFQIIFFDPPFVKKEFIEELRLIKKTKIFSSNHIVVIHREKKTNDAFEDIIKPIIIKNYGRSKIIFAKF